jgi:hypothetical protein
MQDTCEFAEISQLRPRPGLLLKPPPAIVRTGHHEMPRAVAITTTYLDEGLPACGVRLLLPSGFRTLQPFQ